MSDKSSTIEETQRNESTTIKTAEELEQEDRIRDWEHTYTTGILWE